MLALWREDYGRAASLFDRVAQALAQTREHRAFWLAMRALALLRAADYGDEAAAAQARAALRAAATAGAVSTFFTRLRLAEARLTGAATGPADVDDDLFATWDRLIDRHEPRGRNSTAGPGGSWPTSARPTMTRSLAPSRKSGGTCSD